MPPAKSDWQNEKTGDLKVTLREDSQQLKEVVVTAMGIKKDTKRLGYAVSTIESDEIVKAGATNFASAMYGKAPGIRITQTQGGAAGAVSINVRGLTSITGNNQPLIILDGVPISSSDFNTISPSDIENISVLKDASSTSIYGARAANGVVVVTTKKGQQKSKNTVSVNAYYGWQKNSRWIQPADAKTYVNAYTAAETWAGRTDGERKFSREDYDKWMAGTEKGYTGFDWGDYIWKTSTTILCKY